MKIEIKKLKKFEHDESTYSFDLGFSKHGDIFLQSQYCRVDELISLEENLIKLTKKIHNFIEKINDKN